MKYKNNDLISYMFRYLEKYTGKYRVLPYYDTSLSDFPRDNTGAIDSSFDDLYIPCKKGVIKHTYDDFDKLALCIYDKRSKVAKSIFDDICKKYPNIDISLVMDGNDNYIYFYDKDLNKVATIVRPKTSGAKIKWDDKRNLPKIEYNIPEEDTSKLSKITSKLSKTGKMHFMKKCNSEFLESITNDNFDAKLEMKKSRLATKEYIHSLGLWDKYIKFISKKSKEVKNDSI